MLGAATYGAPAEILQKNSIAPIAIRAPLVSPSDRVDADHATTREERRADGGHVFDRGDWTITSIGQAAVAEGPGGTVRVLGELVVVQGVAPACVVRETIDAAQLREARRG